MASYGYGNGYGYSYNSYSYGNMYVPINNIPQDNSLANTLMNL